MQARSWGWNSRPATWRPWPRLDAAPPHIARRAAARCSLRARRGPRRSPSAHLPSSHLTPSPPPRRITSNRQLERTGSGDLTPGLRLAAGAGAGIVAMSLTYPLDMVRGRLTVQEGRNVQYHGIVHAARTIMREVRQGGGCWAGQGMGVGGEVRVGWGGGSGSGPRPGRRLLPLGGAVWYGHARRQRLVQRRARRLPTSTHAHMHPPAPVTQPPAPRPPHPPCRLAGGRARVLPRLAAQRDRGDTLCRPQLWRV